ncbi:MAG: signal peptidase I [Leptolyngbyaceae cyanobacterium SM1_1_3]|nr:signal peptidase I [Leptolyngbyaceae cyanobacterium SM1_1_3]NJN03107.1 signal peptidase I [Leptolyngbyaceae cyanobacterium RM1_1_2]NJO09607.1 signal peptidase I [Leptolyngbyaceae cyanobacterium SL_1_1]
MAENHPSLPPGSEAPGSEAPGSETPSPEETSNRPGSAALPPAKAQATANPWIEALQTVGLSVVLALGIRHFVAEARYIPSGSMEPTLQINDRLVIEKISYRFNPPVREDIVVFWPPENLFPAGGRRDAFIKRVIGLPGESVEVKEGKVFVEGQALEEDYIKAPPNYQWGPEIVPADQYLVLGDNRNSSFDSHSWGFVPQDNIIGRAAVRFWPPQRLGGLD